MPLENVFALAIPHLQLPGVAAATGIAVDKLLTATDTADAAGAAVKLLFLCLVIKKGALQAHVSTCVRVVQGIILTAPTAFQAFG